MEYLVTGSVDDVIKVWELQDSALKVKHKLTGHSLGVVSVAVSSDGSSKLLICKNQIGNKIGKKPIL